ncbi:XdhC family protein [Gluconobacter morbifer]|uniref:Xanthine dehydrogenase n=1 Tax=Gluconobacter morbifer G707 TaxID=1088869 RepID=G6XLT8_9PROT|nr:XdhC family protein [Gluconobacter morbifer]EHH67343.1 hypothetical protein GMO_23370 [Gluconobacter morbifer G707]
MAGTDRLAPLPEWPEYGLTEDLLPTLSDWARRGKKVALATLVHITGSSPRPLGSEMIISEEGEVQGYVSGGCVEAAVAAEAQECLRDGTSRMLDYGAGSPVLDIQLTCGGRIGIFVRPLQELDRFVALRQDARTKRHPVYSETDLCTGSMQYTSSAPFSRENIFIKAYLPPLQLIVAGSDPVTLALICLAPQFGLQPFLLKPLGPRQPPASLPHERYDRRSLKDALPDLTLDRWTSVYALTHNAQIDMAVTEYALKSEAFCVGILGSRRKIDGRIRTLRTAGLSEEALKRLHLPAGLEIGAKTPHEIALSILAQIIKQYYA